VFLLQLIKLTTRFGGVSSEGVFVSLKPEEQMRANDLYCRVALRVSLCLFCYVVLFRSSLGL
jgi:hypothetical protein